MGGCVEEVRWISNGSLLLLRFCICVSSSLVCESLGMPSHHSSVRKPWYHLDRSLSEIALHLQRQLLYQVVSGDKLSSTHRRSKVYIYQSLYPLGSVNLHLFPSKNPFISGGASTSLTSFRGTAFEGRAAPSRQQGRENSAVRSNIPCFSSLLLLSLCLSFSSVLIKKNLLLKSAEEASTELVPFPTQPIPIGLLLSNLVQLDFNFHWKSECLCLGPFCFTHWKGATPARYRSFLFNSLVCPP